MAAQTDLQFDGWTVNRVSGDISRGERSSRLAQQPLRILLELFDHAGEVVTREHLVKVLWPAGVVDFDNGLNVAMRKLRVALDDVGEVPRYIETLPRVGYRFIGKPGSVAAANAPESARRMPQRARWALALGSAGVVIALVLGRWVNFGAETDVPAVRHHEPSVRAQELYLEALSLRSRRDIETHGMVLEKLQAAVKEDPEYAQAWAAMADSYSAGVIRQVMTAAEGVPKARAAAERAIALDDNLVDGHMSLGEILTDHDKDFAAAKKQFERAASLNDKSGRLWHHYGMWYGHTGQLPEALAALRRARELEPMTLLYGANYGMLLYESRRYDEAIEFLKPLVEANPKFDQARSILARAMTASGDLPGALEQLQARTSTGPYQGDLGVLYAKMNRRDEAMGEIGRLEEHGRAGFGVAYEQALIYVAMGDLDRGCEKLALALTDHSVLVNWMRLDPPLDPLRGRQCYADAAQRLYGAPAN
jgi:DNA-binding winged helix-turn-helix (wHTH) protein/Tfp pilus assembly protein PilF